MRHQPCSSALVFFRYYYYFPSVSSFPLSVIIYSPPFSASALPHIPFPFTIASLPSAVSFYYSNLSLVSDEPFWQEMGWSHDQTQYKHLENTTEQFNVCAESTPFPHLVLTSCLSLSGLLLLFLSYISTLQCPFHSLVSFSQPPGSTPCTVISMMSWLPFSAEKWTLEATSLIMCTLHPFFFRAQWYREKSKIGYLQVWFLTLTAKLPWKFQLSYDV